MRAWPAAATRSTSGTDTAKYRLLTALDETMAPTAATTAVTAPMTPTAAGAGGRPGRWRSPSAKHAATSTPRQIATIDGPPMLEAKTWSAATGLAGAAHGVPVWRAWKTNVGAQGS